jgi:hypothetical protein
LGTFADDVEVDVDVGCHCTAGAAAVEVLNAWLQLRLSIKQYVKLMLGWQHLNIQKLWLHLRPSKHVSE